MGVGRRPKRTNGAVRKRPHRAVFDSIEERAVTFEALTTGKTSIAILANGDLQFYDSNFNPIVIDDSVTTSPTLETFPTNQSLSASVMVTPEPSSGQLMLLGGVMWLIALTCAARLKGIKLGWLQR